MKESYFLRGSGGQGVQAVGMMLLHTADEMKKHASFYPEYGGSKRGGYSQCAVMISDEQISSFTDKTFTCLALMNKDSFDKYKDAVKEEGVLVYNSSLIKDELVSNQYGAVGVPLDALAREAGNQKAVNTVLYGFLTRYKNLADLETAKKIVEGHSVQIQNFWM